MPSAPSATAVADPLAFLAGAWSVAREVRDHAAGQDGTFVGSAAFTPADDGLRWTEEGTLRLGSFAGHASRALEVRPAGDAWEVRFDDGRYFHPLDLRTGRCAVDHPCGEDHYAGEIVVEGPDAVVVAWRVVGPAKDQTIVSRYTR